MAEIDETRPDNQTSDNQTSDNQTMVLKAVAILAIVVGGFLALSWLLDYGSDRDANRLILGGAAIGLGVFGVFGLFWAMDAAVDLLPARIRERFRPYVFVGPALALLAVFMIYPVVNTVLI